MPKAKRKPPYEKYDVTRSPFAQRATQRDIAKLVHETVEDLNLLGEPRFKETFICRRSIITSGKERDLVYPVGRLRAVHERFKYHFNKVIQPSYLMSPRKNRSQRDNAHLHLNQRQYLTIDIKQFYPSTSRVMVRNSLIDLFGMKGDVAGLIAHLSTADDRCCFGSPLTPILSSLVHRKMFDEIAELVAKNNLSFSLWVDDLTISGEFIFGQVQEKIRAIITKYGLKSHKIKFKTGNRTVFITGIGIVGDKLVAPRAIEVKIADKWQILKEAQSNLQYESAANDLLTVLGSVRHIVGPKSERGQKIANQMHSIRQKKQKRVKLNASSNNQGPLVHLSEQEKEMRSKEIESLPF